MERDASSALEVFTVYVGERGGDDAPPRRGQRNHDALFGPEDWRDFRGKLADAIEALRK